MKNKFGLTIILFFTLFVSYGQTNDLIVDTTFWDNGKIKSISHYKYSGKYPDKKDVNNRHGNFQYFYETGELEENRFYKNGSQDSIITYYYKNGNKKEEGFLRPCRVGIWTTWFENGNKESQGVWDCVTRLKKWTFWDSIGRIKSEVIYSGKAYSSTHYTYHPNNKIETIKKYKGPYIIEAQDVSAATKKTGDIITVASDFSGDCKHYPVGIWKTYNDKGELTSELKYGN